MSYGFGAVGWGLTGGVWPEIRERKIVGLFSHERRDMEMSVRRGLPAGTTGKVMVLAQALD